MSKDSDAFVSISRFNKGEASKIFDELRSTGRKIVVKNNRPVAVLLAPESYDELIEKIENFELLLEADRRMKGLGDRKLITSSEMPEHLGITRGELDDLPDVELDLIQSRIDSLPK